MADTVRSLIAVLPRWMFVVAFFVILVFMIVSLFVGTFKIAGYEFGFASASASAAKPQMFTVTGSVRKSDDNVAGNIDISPRFPPFKTTGNGEIVGLEVWRDPNGKFPTLAFQYLNYTVEAVDLNDSALVRVEDTRLKILQPVVLRPIPQ